jgi:RecB family exonuclease
VIEELIKRLLSYDESQAPFTILGLERELAIPFKISPGLNVRLKGIFDRIDIHEKYTHILDYKTGGDDPSLPKELTSLFNDSKRKIPFQVLMYVMIYQRINPDALIKAGIYQVRKSAEKVVFLTNDEPVSQELISEYSDALKEMIAEIFNEEIDFKQTDDIKKCGYCDFIRICNRMN